ncbi:MAG: hypothetical protein U5K81_01255 [Trueperaceae bacterium]|nr:hypothetical protein [Trueperaceae bacterium]
MILADEPTGNLDTTASEAILALLGEVRRERRATLVLVTHDRDVAAGVDRILRLVDGRVVGEEEGP